MDRLKKRKSVDSRDEIWCVCVISHGIAVDRKKPCWGPFQGSMHRLGCWALMRIEQWFAWWFRSFCFWISIPINIINGMMISILIFIFVRLWNHQPGVLAVVWRRWGCLTRRLPNPRWSRLAMSWCQYGPVLRTYWFLLIRIQTHLHVDSSNHR